MKTFLDNTYFCIGAFVLGTTLTLTILFSLWIIVSVAEGVKVLA